MDVKQFSRKLIVSDLDDVSKMLHQMQKEKVQLENQILQVLVNVLVTYWFFTSNASIIITIVYFYVFQIVKRKLKMDIFLYNVIVNMMVYKSKKFRIILMNKKTHKTQF